MESVELKSQKELAKDVIFLSTEILKLQQERDKYKKMWNELKEYSIAIKEQSLIKNWSEYERGLHVGYTNCPLKMKEIEQKYEIIEEEEIEWKKKNINTN